MNKLKTWGLVLILTLMESGVAHALIEESNGNTLIHGNVFIENGAKLFGDELKLDNSGSEITLEANGTNLSIDTNLHVNGQIRLTGGTPQNGEVLVTDSDGDGTWSDSLNLSGTVTAGSFNGDGSAIKNISATSITGSVVNATNASTADIADLAALATNAANATMADVADLATNAVNATTANTANLAVLATNANNADTADMADSALVVTGATQTAIETLPSLSAFGNGSVVSSNGGVTVTNGQFTGNGAGLTNIPASSIVGVIPFASVANATNATMAQTAAVATNAANATTANTANLALLATNANNADTADMADSALVVTGATQTSIETLPSLSAFGNGSVVSSNGGVTVTNGQFTGNGAGLTNIPASSIVGVIPFASVANATNATMAQTAAVATNAVNATTANTANLAVLATNANNADTADMADSALVVTGATQTSIETLPSLSAFGNGSVVSSNGGVTVTNGQFTGNGAGLTNIPASSIVGVIPFASVANATNATMAQTAAVATNAVNATTANTANLAVLATNANNADTADMADSALVVTGATQTSIETLPSLSAFGNGSVVSSNGGVTVTNGQFTGNGAGLTNIPASSIVGVIPFASVANATNATMAQTAAVATNAVNATTANTANLAVLATNANNADTADMADSALVVTGATQSSIETLPSLSAFGNGSVVSSNGGVTVTNGQFTGNGAGLTNIPASSIVGVIPFASVANATNATMAQTAAVATNAVNATTANTANLAVLATNANNADTADMADSALVVTGTTQTSIETLPSLSAFGNGSVVSSNGGVTVTNGQFTGNGAGLTNIPASSIVGVIPFASVANATNATMAQTAAVATNAANATTANTANLAVLATNASNADTANMADSALVVTGATQTSIETLPSLSAFGNGSVVSSNGGVTVTNGQFTGNGAGLTNIPASSIVGVIPFASVANADNATMAQTAAVATNAVNATTANTANLAVLATNATNADTANMADTATNADNATTADTASVVTNTNQTLIQTLPTLMVFGNGTPVTSNGGLTVINGTISGNGAGLTNISSTSITSVNGDSIFNPVASAVNASNADTANMADTAAMATLAATATNAANATTANTANLAVLATNANNADTADMADSALVVTGATQTSIETLPSLSVFGNGSAVSSNGGVTVTNGHFTGNGAGLTNIPASSIVGVIPFASVANADNATMAQTAAMATLAATATNAANADTANMADTATNADNATTADTASVVTNTNQTLIQTLPTLMVFGNGTPVTSNGGLTVINGTISGNGAGLTNISSTSITSVNGDSIFNPVASATNAGNADTANMADTATNADNATMANTASVVTNTNQTLIQTLPTLKVFGNGSTVTANGGLTVINGTISGNGAGLTNISSTSITSVNGDSIFNPVASAVNASNADTANMADTAAVATLAATATNAGNADTANMADTASVVTNTNQTLIQTLPTLMVFGNGTPVTSNGGLTVINGTISGNGAGLTNISSTSITSVNGDSIFNPVASAVNASNADTANMADTASVVTNTNQTLIQTLPTLKVFGNGATVTANGGLTVINGTITGNGAGLTNISSTSITSVNGDSIFNPVASATNASNADTANMADTAAMATLAATATNAGNADTANMADTASVVTNTNQTLIQTLPTLMVFGNGTPVTANGGLTVINGTISGNGAGLTNISSTSITSVNGDSIFNPVASAVNASNADTANMADTAAMATLAATATNAGNADTANMADTATNADNATMANTASVVTNTNQTLIQTLPTLKVLGNGATVTANGGLTVINGTISGNGAGLTNISSTSITSVNGDSIFNPVASAVNASNADTANMADTAAMATLAATATTANFATNAGRASLAGNADGLTAIGRNSIVQLPSLTDIGNGTAVTTNGDSIADDFCTNGGECFRDAVAAIKSITASMSGVSVVDFRQNSTWTVPLGVSSVRIEVWGAGGGGGGGGVDNHYSGGAGGAGSYSRSDLAVVPGETYAINIGAAGQGGATPQGSPSAVHHHPGQPGTDGNPSSFVAADGTVLVLANGGKGGVGGRTKNPGPNAGGAGGKNGTGQFTINGANGSIAGIQRGAPAVVSPGGARDEVAGSGNGGSGGISYGNVNLGRNTAGGDGGAGLVLLTYNSQDNKALSTMISYTTPGNHSFHVPVGVHRIKVRAIGAGGAGGTSQRWNLCGQSGGAGGYVESYLAVSPGNDIPITVGSTLPSNSHPHFGLGGDTRIKHIVAGGGVGGATAYSYNQHGPPAAGGSASGGDFNAPGGAATMGAGFGQGGTGAGGCSGLYTPTPPIQPTGGALIIEY